MGTVVWAAATAHTGAMLRTAPQAGDDQERVARVFAAFRSLGLSLRSAQPDVIVTIATDHFLTFDYAALPVFAIGTGDRFAGWGEFGVPQRVYAGVPDFGEAVHAAMVEESFDVVSAREMRLDHSFSCPLQLLMEGWDAPVLPVYVNCTVEPLPSLRRCWEFGAALGRTFRRSAVRRIALLGTGGLSHWVGMPQTGTINSEFDRRFLELFSAGRFAELIRWSSYDVSRTAGNGAAEIRNWIIAAAAADATGARVIAYEPVAAWVTGIGVTELLS